MNRIKLALGLVMSLALLSNQACDRPPGESSSSTMATLSRLVDRGLALVTPPSSTFTLRIDSAAAVPPGQQFRVVVSYRDPTGHLMNVPTPVTLKLNPNTAGGTLTGDLKRVPVNGVATFDGLAVDKVGDGYTLTASAVKVPDATSRAFSVAYSVVAPPQPVGSSPATAQPISPDVPVLGALLPGHVDYYVFHAGVGDLLTVSSYSNRIDIANWDTSLRLRLIAPDGTTEIARSGATSADADGVDNGFSLLRAPQEGDYYLACDVDEQGFLSGAYALVLNVSPNPGATLQTETEGVGVTGENDTPATAQALSPGVLYGHFDTPQTNATASDFYKITILNPTRVRIDVTAARNGNAYGDVLWDPRLELQDATGAVLWSNDNTYGLDPVIDYIVTNPGTYYVRVTRADFVTNTGASPYFLSYNAVPFLAIPVLAGNSSAATATPIGYGATVTGSFGVAGDQYFAFGGSAGDVVSLAVLDRTQTQGASLTLKPSASADAVLLGTDGATAIASGAVFSSTAESKLNLRQAILQATGTYFVRVRSATAGSFGLRVDRVSASDREVEPNDTTATATRIGPSGWISGVLGSAGDQDHFLVHAEAGQFLTLGLLAAPGKGIGTSLSDFGSALMPKLEVRNLQGGTLSVTSADRKGQFNFADSVQRSALAAPMTETAFRAPAAADYEVVVSDADGQGGAQYFYALNVRSNW